jgi:hypothetical protein
VAEPAAGVLSRLPAPRRPFEVGLALRRIRKAVRPLPKAAMFALAEEGHRSLYRQVVACILSVRTYDEVSLVAARTLFEAAPEPADLARLAPSAIDPADRSSRCPGSAPSAPISPSASPAASGGSAWTSTCTG